MKFDEETATLDRRAFFLMAVSALLVSAVSGPSHAQDAGWPQRPIRMLVGVPAGYAPDIASRELAEQLGKELGQPLFVENRPGGSAALMMRALMASAPDGSTIASVFWNQMSVAPSLFNNLGYDPVEDVAHIGIWMSGPQLLVTHRDSGIRSVGQLIEKARAAQPPLQYASFGVGSPSHIFTQLLLEKANINMEHVPFSGPKVMQAIINREVPLAMGGVSDMLPIVRAGKLVALAVTGDRRLATLPDVPTMADAGVPGLNHKVWFGLIAPKGTPSAIIDRLHRALQAAAANPEFRARMEQAGRIVSVGTPDAMRETIRSEIPLWAGVVKRAGITAQ